MATPDAIRQLGHLAQAILITVATCAEAVPYGVASWPEEGRGNHRALIRVAAPAEAVWAHIEWRRRDPNPETKDIRVYDLTTGERVTNVVRVNVTREFGDIIFQPATVPGDYAVYYLPYNPGQGNFDDPGTYFPPEDTADPTWRERWGLSAQELAAGQWRNLPQAEVVEIQARGDFHRMDPMEVIATAEETEALLAQHPDSSYLLFPEDRRYPIRMSDDLPLRWIENGPANHFSGQAQPGEFYVFQIGVYAARRAIPNLELDYGDLVGEQGRMISASAFTCFNLGGTDWRGRPMTKTFEVAAGKVRPLWIGVAIPRDAEGTYEGVIRVRPEGAPDSQVRLTLSVSGPLLEDAGDSELWRHSRLRWLNSTIGLDDEVVAPFTPLELNGDTVHLLGRSVTFNGVGLPASIISNGRELLAEGMRFVVETSEGPVHWHPGGGQVVERAPARLRRKADGYAEQLALHTDVTVEADGCVMITATLRAERDLDLRDVRLEVPVRREVASYMMGLSKRGGIRPRQWRWKWDETRADNQLWIGDVQGGLQLQLRGPKDTWNLLNYKPEGMPPSWYNQGKGGCDVTEEGDRVMVRAYSGPRRMEAGETLEFRFRLLITPFKPIDRRHWNWRVGDVFGEANILHIHHATWENPYINYPFLTVERLASTVAKVKAIRSRERDFGTLTYPAAGNIRLDQGALHIWARPQFDPQVRAPGNAAYNQSLFSLSFPNEDEVGFYWNIDDQGMRVYVRHGAPERNHYAIVMGSTSDWQQGEPHLLTLSWGEGMAIFVDGKLLAASNFRGTLDNDPALGTLRLQGRWILDAIKITGTPYEQGAAVTPSVDEHTLLLDTFDTWDGGDRTRPEKAAGGQGGRVEGVVEKVPEQAGGSGIRFSSRVEEVPPKGVNLYYTVRELSNHVVEMWALRSLGDEIFSTGEHFIYGPDRATVATAGGGYPWLQEHLVSGYVPAWRQPLWDGDHDAAIATQGLSRWHNYYLEGLRWLMENTGVDGLYLDGIGYDREVMKRVVKVMSRTNPNYRINFHCGNDYDYMDRRTSPANEYMEHFPYLSNLWFGELFDYNRSPDYWLVEISGIPFGLTSEMLDYQTGGNPYRGMVFGMTGRLHPSAPAMWRFWDEFGIQDAEWLGYWDPACPVRTDRPDVLATVYRKPDKTLIALGHWPSELSQPSATTRPTPTAPTVDGRLTPGEWDQAARLTNFIGLGSQDLAELQTECFVTYDEQRLYLAFRCATGGAPLKATATGRDGIVWEDDAVEVFIQPDINADRYYQFIGNSTGAFADGVGIDRSWDGEWDYRASVGDGVWEAELSIPFASLGMATPTEGTTIGLNFARDQQSPRAYLSSWAPTFSSFHEVGSLGRLTFFANVPATRQQTVEQRERAIPVRLSIDWAAVGLDPARATLRAPRIAYFQNAAQFAMDEPIPVEFGKGWLLVLEEK